MFEIKSIGLRNKSLSVLLFVTLLIFLPRSVLAIDYSYSLAGTSVVNYALNPSSASDSIEHHANLESDYWSNNTISLLSFLDADNLAGAYVDPNSGTLGIEVRSSSDPANMIWDPFSGNPPPRTQEARADAAYYTQLYYCESPPCYRSSDLLPIPASGMDDIYIYGRFSPSNDRLWYRYDFEETSYIESTNSLESRDRSIGFYINYGGDSPVEAWYSDSNGTYLLPPVTYTVDPAGDYIVNYHFSPLTLPPEYYTSCVENCGELMWRAEYMGLSATAVGGSTHFMEFNVSKSPIAPEPSTYLLTGIGFVIVGGGFLRKRFKERVV
jgi:hypothetical protein